MSHSEQTLSTSHTKDEAGVCEAYPGIIESSDIDPLHHERIKEERSSSSATSKVGGALTYTSLLASPVNTATGAAKYVYSAAIGDEAGKKSAKESVFGSSK